MMCIVQGHNKQACRLVLDAIPIVLSAKQGSYQYHDLKTFGLNQLGNKPQNYRPPNPSSDYRAGNYMYMPHCIPHFTKNSAHQAGNIVDRNLMLNLLVSAIQILLR